MYLSIPNPDYFCWMNFLHSASSISMDKINYKRLDDMGFKLASMGLISTATQEACMHVAGLNRQSASKEAKQKHKVTKRLLILFLALALLGPYFYVASWQYFLCKSLYIQFGDAMPDVSYYSGVFTMQGKLTTERNETKKCSIPMSLLIIVLSSSHLYLFLFFSKRLSFQKQKRGPTFLPG